MLRNILLPTLFASVVCCSLGYAQDHQGQTSTSTVQQLGEYLDQQMTAMEAGVVGGNSTVRTETKESTYFLRRFWLRIQAKVGVSLPGLLKVQVIPEVETLWERPLPDGWVAYKP